MPTPEAAARERIDEALTQAGWAVQDHKAANIAAGPGVAVREVPLKKGHGTADYLLFVNGQAVPRSTLGSLFGVIDTTYGIGNGSTTFNVPNQLGKVPVGLDTGQSGFAALGVQGGEKAHALSGTELAGHVHLLTNGTASVHSTASRGSHVHLPGTLSTNDPGGHVHSIGYTNSTYQNGGTGQVRPWGAATTTRAARERTPTPCRTARRTRPRR
jgi:microcystin-dependent protein